MRVLHRTLNHARTAVHEASLAGPLLRLVLEETARHGKERRMPLRVTRIRVRAGLLLGMEAPALRGVFALMSEGTAAEGAELVVEIEPMRGSCPDCGAAALTAGTRDFRCPACQGADVDWTGGSELYIASIEVQPAAPDAACGAARGTCHAH